MQKNRFHIDRYSPADWMTSRFEKTDEGYLKGRAIVTNTGVFIYKDIDGNEIRELRPPEEVFDRSSIDTLKMKPVTNMHPTELVNAENIKQYQIGHLGENPSTTNQFSEALRDSDLTDGYHVAVDMIITDKEAIEKDILSGKRTAISCGYKADLEKAEPGAMWLGQPYDYIQRNIRYNHVAVVDSARAGNAARIRLDSNVDNIYVTDVQNFKEKEAFMPDTFKNITLDGVEYKAEAEVLKVLNQYKSDSEKIKAEAEELKKANSKLEGERDSLKEKVDSLTEENKKIKEESVDVATIDALVKQRANLISTAEKVDVEVKEDMNDVDIMKAIILKKSPKVNLDGKDDIYIQARYDSIVESLEEEIKNDAQTRTVRNPVTNNSTTQNVDKYDSRSARQRMIDNLRKRSMGVKE